jgi:TPP-dependent pyruvate/acetoin dehydrogenase alpha subunit
MDLYTSNVDPPTAASKLLFPTTSYHTMSTSTQPIKHHTADELKRFEKQMEKEEVADKRALSAAEKQLAAAEKNAKKAEKVRRLRYRWINAFTVINSVYGQGRPHSRQGTQVRTQD